MKKRILSFFLCVTLLLPFTVLSAGGAQAADTTGYVLRDIDFKISGVKTVADDNDRSFIIASARFTDPIDLTQYGFPKSGLIEAGKLGLQFDTYISGDDDMVNKIEQHSGAIAGNWEFTSSGTYDKEEMSCNTRDITFKNNKWVRQVMDFHTFEIVNTAVKFDPSNWNFTRLFIVRFPSEDVGRQCTVKIMNVRLVDLTKQAPSVEEDPIGDGSFKPDAPVWRTIKVGEGYNNDDVIVAGYDLAEYMDTHPELSRTNYSPVIQSLMNELETVGGGTLYIPEGVYPCLSEITVPHGVTIYGDWQDPTLSPKIGGTILSVQCGAGKTSKTGTPFVTMSNTSKIQNISFWYPEQSATSVQFYPATVEMSSYTYLQNITLVNSYQGILQRSNANCPKAFNIYGTPLNCGMDMDMITDVGRFEQVHFSPDYWENSALENAPAGDEEKAELEKYLYYNATGILLRRIDWSYLIFSSVEKYATGVAFAKTNVSTWSEYPDGQCYGLRISDCATGLYVAGSKEYVADSVFENCTTAVMLSDKPAGVLADGDGYLELINCEINGAATALDNRGVVPVSLMSCKINDGEVTSSCGHLTAIDTVFATTAPQITFAAGAVAGLIMDCRTADGGEITWQNEAHCPVNATTDVEIPAVVSVSEEAVSAQVRKPARDAVYIADDLDATGETDVSLDLQLLLNEIKADGGGTLYLPAGFYRLDGTFSIPSGIQILGAVDNGRIPYRCGTVFEIYGGKGKETGAIVTLKEDSGIRGVVFDYPEQFAEKEFVPYPYTLQGAGKDIYVINVSIRNGWNGLDLLTNRCDNHYVDHFSGMCVNNEIQVGGGSQNGLLRHYQFNYNALLFGATTSFGAWTSLPLSDSEFEPIMRSYLENHEVVCRLGNVTNELLFGCFNYSAKNGLLFTEDNGGSADATIVMHGMDYSNEAVRVEQARRVDILIMPVTSFWLSGDVFDTGWNYGNCCIHLTDTFDGTVNVTGMHNWHDCMHSFVVEGGTLNIYGYNYSPTSRTVAQVGENGRLNLVNVIFERSGKLSLVDGTAENVFINGGYYYYSLADADNLGGCENMSLYRSRWDVPTNAKIADNAELIFTEAFTDYTFDTFTKQAGAGTSVTAKSGSVLVDLGTGTTAGISTTVGLPSGEKAAYRLELRIKVSALQSGSRILLILTGIDGDAIYPVTISAAGLFAGQDGEEALYSAVAGTWYRLALDLDLQTPGKKTYRLHVCDDDGKELAAGAPVLLPEELQEEGADIVNLWFGAMADTAADGNTESTAISLDYLFITRQNGLCGDVDGSGAIDSTDARLILQYYAKKITADAIDLGAADVDGGGTVDSTDARLILQYYAKKIDKLPAA